MYDRAEFTSVARLSALAIQFRIRYDFFDRTCTMTTVTNLNLETVYLDRCQFVLIKRSPIHHLRSREYSLIYNGGGGTIGGVGNTMLDVNEGLRILFRVVQNTSNGHRKEKAIRICGIPVGCCK